MLVRGRASTMLLSYSIPSVNTVPIASGLIEQQQHLISPSTQLGKLFTIE